MDGTGQAQESLEKTVSREFEEEVGSRHDFTESDHVVTHFSEQVRTLLSLIGQPITCPVLVDCTILSQVRAYVGVSADFPPIFDNPVVWWGIHPPLLPAIGKQISERGTATQACYLHHFVTAVRRPSNISPMHSPYSTQHMQMASLCNCPPSIFGP